MNKAITIAFLMFIGSGLGSVARADTLISYPDPGTVNSDIYTFRALATGDVTGFFGGVSAADNSVVGLGVNGAAPTGFALPNQSTAISQSFDFGSVVAGDVLSFILRNLTTGTQFSSNPVSNPDGLQHVFAANFTNSSGAIPSGVQVSFEDLAKSQGSDFDFNDASFVFTNVTTDPLGGGGASANPIPAALPLFTGGLGMLGALLLRRRKLSRGA